MLTLAFVASLVLAQAPLLSDTVPVAGQPLAQNVTRVVEALSSLGAPLDEAIRRDLLVAAAAEDGDRMQKLLDTRALAVVHINPETRVKVSKGTGTPTLQQGGYTPHLIKVVNQSTVTKELRISSPQAGQVYAGMSRLSAERMQRLELRETDSREADPKRFLDVAMHTAPPLSRSLSGLEVEYAVVVIYSSLAGKLEATLQFDIGQGTQDLGFRGEVALLFAAQTVIPVRLRIRDADGRPTLARLTFRDAGGRVHPPQAKRLAPDLFFQEHVYRGDGETVLLPPGRLTLEQGRGPEYVVQRREIDVKEGEAAPIEVQLERWVEPAKLGFYSGDHHIHGAGCAHYTSPSEGVTPEDMFRQVRGEGLNVGCVLTWGPCFDYQRRFFSPGVDKLSLPLEILKYDLEISGFGSESLGHVCLLNLKDQTYPGSEGTKTKGWPRWTTPVMRWAKAQGGVTGYAHSGSGLEIVPTNAVERLMRELDTDRDGLLTRLEAAPGLLPRGFDAIDADRDAALSATELHGTIDAAADELPNLAVPEMNGVGAMEICVSVAAGVCDFLSAMDTPRIAEWNIWYHILNCGFPLKVSGETDFPCMSGDRVGQGRVYVRLGVVEHLDFGAWCDGLARGRSYVSDGFAHALDFTVAGVRPGEGDVRRDVAGMLEVRATVAFAPGTPATVAQGLRTPPGGRRWLGDTVTMHGPPTRSTQSGGQRLVEVVVNGKAVATQIVEASGQPHELSFRVALERSSWVALRHFPQLHTNPVNVLVGDAPIRASRSSALWCAATIRRLWEERGRFIPADEQVEARAAFDRALEQYEKIAAECPDDGRAVKRRR